MPCPCKRRELFTNTSTDSEHFDGRYKRYMGDYQPYYDAVDEDDLYCDNAPYNPFAIQQQQLPVIIPIPIQTKMPTFMCCVCLILILIMAYLMYKKSF